MTDEVWTYFKEQYAKSSIKVVPGNWPDFKIKEEVDDWLGMLTRLSDVIDNMCREKV
jgi:hypothetical protein